MSARSLHDVWLADKPRLVSDARSAWDLARKANGAGEHLLAIEIAETVLEALPAGDTGPLRQQQALALGRLGSTREALATLETLRGGGAEDGETLGLKGRMYKDLAAAAPDAAGRRELLATSQRLYQEGFERSGAPYCGINAAAQAVLLEDVELASQLAEKTLARTPEADEFWTLATRAEATLILGRVQDAGDLYRRAADVVGGRWADLAATRKQCRALCLALHGRRDALDACFPAGAVAVFAGHIVDAPERKTPRFPALAEEGVRERIAAWLAANAVRFGFSSAAAGADLVFLAAAQKAGIETHVVLPFAAAEFLETSVRCHGQRWTTCFEEALERAASITIVNDQVADERSSAFDFSNRMVAAKAALRARALDMPLKALAVWDGCPGDGRGGAADALAGWSRAKIPIHVIHPTDSARDAPVHEESAVSPVPFERTETGLPTGYRTSVCAVMHLFFAGYFGLRENQYAIFREAVLDALARVLAVTAFPPLGRYGFGPDYVFVFDSIRAAGLCAGEVIDGLRRSLAAANEEAIELPRVCLHAGPVQLMVNPVLHQYSHEGATLTRAGRIVRRVAPGIVYCTDAFASLCALESIRELHLEYAGVSRHGAGQGQDRLFSVRYSPA